MSKLLYIILTAILLLVAVLFTKTFLYSSKQHFQDPVKITVNDSVAVNLSEAIRVKTISYDNKADRDTASFKRFIDLLEKKYPLTHAGLEKTIINKYSLLYKWNGKNKNLKPALLLAHMDVVPAEGKWSEDPFSGSIKNKYIWGRGALDDKVSILGILEACESLRKENFQPERTLYFAFGHDEEVMGREGAKNIAAFLKAQNIQAEFILDEGLVITEGIIPGIEQPAALIGIAEKGYLTVNLSANIEGGHSSMPAHETAIGIVSRALSKIENHEMKASISRPAQEFLDCIGPEMPFFKKIIFANQWLFESLIIQAYEKTPSGNALVRTTVVPTLFNAGVKENSVPAHAQATINLRTLPGESEENIMENLKAIVDDERIKMKITTSIPPSKVSSTTTSGFKVIEKSIRQVFPGTYVAPSLMIAGTDSKHYTEISPNIYRFLPIRLEKSDLSRIHGENERIKIQDYKNVVRFYYMLMQNLN